MKLVFEDGTYIQTETGIDCSISLRNSPENPTAWYVSAPEIEPVRANGWVGSVAEGGSVNFRNILFNPHGHGTHTECLGHITEEVYSINGVLKKPFYKTQVVSVVPESRIHSDGIQDQIVTLASLNLEQIDPTIEALFIRTLPNEISKKTRQYSDQNPPYCDVDLIPLINRSNVLHLLIDTPSVDREKDGGELTFHHAFWGVPNAPRFDRTITELVFAPNELEDGIYQMNLQTAPFENDATPSRPVLFRVYK